jgi:hypothetical protein
LKEGIIMIRNDLLESNYHFEEKTPKKNSITVIWLSLFVFLLAVNIIIFFLIRNNADPDAEAGYFDMVLSGIVFAVLPLYFAFKTIVTSFFCLDKKESIKFKVLDDGGIPMCTCREALKTWQIILIYSIPAISAYSIMFLMNITAELSGEYVILIFIMSFFISLDFTLIIYILYLRMKYRPDYISVNKHVYNVTIYSKYIQYDVKE